jgi:hypothetical protein
MFRTYAALLLFLTVGGCATVHQEDLDAWVGHPISDLDKHPTLLTFPVVRTTAADGTEIRDYVNGRNVTQCSGGGSVFAGQVSMATTGENSPYGMIGGSRKRRHHPKPDPRLDPTRPSRT